MKRYTESDDAAFRAALAGLCARPEIQLLKDIPQHKGGTTYSHCVAVAARAYALAKHWRWDIDIPCLVHGAMLHDYYLYDTETMPCSDYRHALTHPRLAVSNAEACFSLGPRERNVILSHMWPIPGAPLPRCREAWLVCLADKLCAWHELYGKRR